MIVPWRQTAVVDKTLTGLREKSSFFLSLTSFFWLLLFSLLCLSVIPSAPVLLFRGCSFRAQEVLTITVIIVYISSNTGY